MDKLNRYTIPFFVAMPFQKFFYNFFYKDFCKEVKQLK